jgi:TrmH family RNA methyltransferase
MTHHLTITSVTNPRVRAAARLRDADARRASGLTIVDGGREVRRAVAAGVHFEELFLDQDCFVRAQDGGNTPHDAFATGMPTGSALETWLDHLAGRGTTIVLLARTAFEKVAFGNRNEGCVGVARFSETAVEGWKVDRDRPVLILEGVEKPGNLGAILRTADAAGLAGVIVCDGRTDPANPATIRASLGTVFSVPLASGRAEDTIRWCAAGTRRVVAARPGGTLPWHAAKLAGSTAILLGSEAHGISPAWQEAADAGRIVFESVHLPMHGAADSLNVSATAAVLAYESLRQRGGS